LKSSINLRDNQVNRPIKEGGIGDYPRGVHVMTAANGRATLTASLLPRGEGASGRAAIAEENVFFLSPFAAKGTATAEPFRPLAAPHLPRPPRREPRAIGALTPTPA
jgi:hypothetical protein